MDCLFVWIVDLPRMLLIDVNNQNVRRALPDGQIPQCAVEGTGFPGAQV